MKKNDVILGGGILIAALLLFLVMHLTRGDAIVKNYGGGPVGLETLAATIGEEAVTLEDVYEPYLLQIGFLTRTPRGRCVTQLAYEHLHLPSPVQPAGTQLSF